VSPSDEVIPPSVWESTSLAAVDWVPTRHEHRATVCPGRKSVDAARSGKVDIAERTNSEASGHGHDAGPDGARFVIAADQDAFLALAVPFFSQARATGQPVVALVDDEQADLLGRILDDADAVTFISSHRELRRPSTRIASLRRAFEVHLAAGAERIHLLDGLPQDLSGPSWQPWIRYCAFATEAFEDWPVTALRVVTGDRVPVAVTERMAAASTGVLVDAFADPAPTIDAPPAIHLADPTPAEARQGVGEVAERTRLATEGREDIVAAVSEIVTNARVHGSPPIELCAWVIDGGIEVTVTDHGGGPRNASVGLVPADRAPGEGGFGLWISHQLCDEVTMHRRGSEFTVRLVIRAEATHP
jgi:anti-sigma regulatory factor (Ser/Thr protein kinase)